MDHPTQSATIPIFVDLDGTLIASDLGQEATFQALKQEPLLLLRLPFWLSRGFAATKEQLAQRVIPDATSLPYYSEVLQQLHELKAAGRKLILATASHERWAKPVAEHLQLFDDVLATTAEFNLKGANKLAGIRDYCQAHGYTEFSYWGDSRADLRVWSAADCTEVVTVNAAASTLSQLTNKPNLRSIVTPQRTRLQAILTVMRPYQWVKNLLIFAAIIFAHAWDDWNKWYAALWAFLAFSLVASGVYVLNDTFDAPADRLHPTKRRRPFATGDLPLAWGPPLTLTLWLLGVVCVLIGLPHTPPNYPAQVFLLGLFCYGMLNIGYSLKFKKHMIVDCMLLAGMYTIRVLLGGIATEIEVSKWLLALSIFLFISLAFAKRYGELVNSLLPESEKSPGRGYSRNDLEMIGSCGVSSGYMAVLVLALYVNSPEMTKLYQNQFALWMICPLLMYWITRLWFITRRGLLIDDPILYALRDRISLLTAAIIVVMMLIATYVGRVPDLLERFLN